MNNAMRHKFTLRETVLLLVLVAVLIIGLYFLLVFYPVRNRTAEIRQQQEDLVLKNDVADIRLEMYNEMQRAIAEVEKVPEAQRTKMYKYSAEEERWINDYILSCLPNETSGSLNSPTRTDTGDGIMILAFRFSFTLDKTEAPDTAYERVKEILTQINSTGRRSQLGNLTVSAQGGADISTAGLSITGTITFYELA